jgi:twitching motility protein PilT
MARLDKFIQAMQQLQGSLLLVAGERVVIVAGTEQRPITAHPATITQIEDLVREVIPPQRADELRREGVSEFDHPSPHGSVKIRVTRDHEGFRAEVFAVGPVAAPPAIAGGGPGREITNVRTLLDDPAPGAPRQGRAAKAVAPAAPPAPAARATDSAAQAQAPAPAPRPAPAAPPAPAAVIPGTPPARVASPAPAGGFAIDELFRKMVAEKCSDLHLATGNPPLFRKDGEIVMLGDSTPLGQDQIARLVLPIAPPPSREEFEQFRDADFAYELSGIARFRCNLFMDLRGMGGVFRVIPSKIPSVQDLGLSKFVLDLCALHKGLVLVTGPTGSGKSTTLAAMIDHVNATRSAHIITIEDPIEFVHANKKCLINQREVGTHTEGFKRALRAALREDPDIVLVGELRDLETVAIAIETAETGHLVFGTLHTNTAPSTVDRVIDQFPTDRQAQVRTMLSESLKGVISQILVRRKGGGRAAAMEILLVNAAVSNLIREAKTFQIPSIMQTGKAQGMLTLNDALLDLVLRKVVEPQEAFAKALAPTEFKALLGRNNISLEA